jgi:hypothetical protein
MKIKTNLRAGKGGDSGAGKNGGTSTDSVDTSSQSSGTVVYYNPPVSRCPGY